MGCDDLRTSKTIWEEIDANYYNSEERKAIDPDPARHIEKSEHYLMREVR